MTLCWPRPANANSTVGGPKGTNETIGRSPHASKLRRLGRSRLMAKYPVTKDRVTKHSLERLALAEIRCQVGCGQIVAVEIEYAPCRSDGNWRIRTVDFGDEQIIIRPARAVDSTHRKLWQRYELMIDS